MIDIAKLLLPLVTFFLGVGFTLWMRSGERRKELTESHAVMLCEAMAAWHQRMHDLQAAALKGDSESYSEKMIDYSQNRHELPRILRCLEVLRADPSASEIVKLGDTFLKVFTKEAQ